MVVVILGCLLAIGVLLGCGSDDGNTEPVSGPLPTGPGDPQAYTERFMSHNPLALAQLEHLVVVELEPTSSHERDTCTETAGVDCIPYIVEEPTSLELSIADDVAELAELVLLDAAGTVVLRQARGEEPGAALLAPGSYRLELHHLLSGDSAAPEEMLFLHPQLADAGEPAASDSAPELVGSGEAPSPTTVSLTAQKDCRKCNFSNGLFEGENFDGLDLEGAIFNGARLRNTTFRGAKIADGRFLDFTSIGARDQPGTKWEMANIDADFTGAVLSRAQFSLRAANVSRWHFTAIFRGAHLDGTVWTGRSVNPYRAWMNGDFRNADLTDSRWEGQLTLVVPSSPTHIPQCTFQGADLTRAKFPGAIKERLHMCRFDKEAESGRVTVLKDADLSGANLSKAPMTDADLSGTILNGTGMEGTDLTRAKLSGAKTTGVIWRGAILTDAMITGISPATLNGLDLARTNFTNVDFSGLDLTRTDLSKAVLDPAPRFGTAVLSDGTLGINLSAHRFPDRYTAFQGKNLSGVDFRGVELLNADLEGVTLNNAQLVGADLNFVNLRGAKLRGATLGIEPGSNGVPASLRGAFMPDIDLTDADLRSVDLTGAHLYGDTSQTLLERVRLDSATLANANCTGAHFSGTFSNTVFVGAQLVNVIFNDATLNTAKFNDAYLQGADFSNARSVRGAVLSNAAVSAAAGTWTYTGVDGTQITYAYEPTKLGPLAVDESVVCPNGARGPCCPTGNLAECLNAKLKPVRNGPFPPIPECVPTGPCYSNCITPAVPCRRTPRPAATPTPR